MTTNITPIVVFSVTSIFTGWVFSLSLLKGLSILDSDVHICRVQGALRGKNRIYCCRCCAVPMALLSYGFVCASLTRDLKASYDVKKRATYLAGTWQGSSSLLLQCRAAHCTLRPVKHWEAPMGSVHSKISGSASSRPRGWQHHF